MKNKNPNFFSYKYYVFSISICLIIGFLASLFTKNELPTWYKTIIKPRFTPPNWVFGLVWPLLYILMGLAWGRILSFEQNFKHLNLKNVLFVLQLFLNFTWCFLFFKRHEIGLAGIEINLLCIISIWVIKFFFTYSKLSGWLMMPYLIWILFANLLNGAIWYLNK